MPSDRRRLASIAQTAEYCATSERTIRYYIAAGLFPAYRLGPRLLRIDLNEVDTAMRVVPATGGAA